MYSYSYVKSNLSANTDALRPPAAAWLTGPKSPFTFKLKVKTESLGIQHDTFSSNTRNQFRQVFEVLRELTALPKAASKQPQGLSA